MAGLGFKKMIMYEALYVPTPAGGKTPSQHVTALWELVRGDERGAAVTYFMCDVVGMPKIISLLFRFFPMDDGLPASMNLVVKFSAVEYCPIQLQPRCVPD